MDRRAQLTGVGTQSPEDGNLALKEIDCPAAALETMGGVCVPNDEACSTSKARMTSSLNPTIDPYSA